MIVTATAYVRCEECGKLYGPFADQAEASRHLAASKANKHWTTSQKGGDMCPVCSAKAGAFGAASRDAALRRAHG